MTIEEGPEKDFNRSIRILSEKDLRTLLPPKSVVDALRDTYRQLASNPQDKGQSLGFKIAGGSIHVKSGLLPGTRSAFAAKVNVNLPDNPARSLPTVQGVLLLADAVSGQPLAIMDSMVLTAIRTAGTMALAAIYGARANSRIIAVIGCGFQAPFQIEALMASFPIEEIRLYDLDLARACALADRLSGVCRVAVAENAWLAVEGADICVTCTSSKSPVLMDGMSLKGCFVAAIGADNPEKIEIDPSLIGRAHILVDDLDQCAAGADLAHALRTGAVSRDGVHAELADLAAGHKSGRRSEDELVIFDSSGSGVQDVCVAWAAYQAAISRGVGMVVNLFDGRIA